MAAIVLGYHYLSVRAGFDLPIWLLASKVVIGALSYLLFMVYIRQSALADCYEVLRELGVSAKKLDRWPFNRSKMPC